MSSLEPYWQADGVTLYHGDCLEVLPTIPDNSVDLIATDPPYFKVKNEPWDRQWDTAAGFLAWLDKVLAQFYRILAPNGSLYLFASPKMAARVECRIGERFNVLNIITWDKPPFSTKAEMFVKESLRCFFPASERIIFAEHHGADNIAKGDIGNHFFQPVQVILDEARDNVSIAQLSKQSGLPLSQVSHYFRRDANGWRLPKQEHLDAMGLSLSENDLRREYEDLRREYEDLRRPFNATADAPYTDVWTFATVPPNNGKHPCEKPLDLMEHIITMSSNPGAVVLDPFMGRCTTGLAVLNLERQFIGIDQSEKWCSASRARLTDGHQLEMEGLA